MTFKQLYIRFQTAALIPAPFMHFYTLTARSSYDKFLTVDFSITYPDRDELDEEDITGEGFTLNDDFSWSGRLPEVWLGLMRELAAETTLAPFSEDELDENDDFLDVTLEDDAGQRQGTPTDRDAFLYRVQELIQAVYEAGEREKPFELTYLDLSRQGDRGVRLRASFVDRVLTADVRKPGQSRSRKLPWSDLQPIMSVVYEVDYDPAEALDHEPSRNGQYLNFGGPEWYNVGDRPAIQQLFERLL